MKDIVAFWKSNMQSFLFVYFSMEKVLHVHVRVCDDFINETSLSHTSIGSDNHWAFDLLLLGILACITSFTIR